MEQQVPAVQRHPEAHVNHWHLGSLELLELHYCPVPPVAPVVQLVLVVRLAPAVLVVQ